MPFLRFSNTSARVVLSMAAPVALTGTTTHAWAVCTPEPGVTIGYICSGATSGFNLAVPLSIDTVSVKFLPNASITANGVALSGSKFTNIYYQELGPVSVTGSNFGVSATTSGEGEISIGTFSGSVLNGGNGPGVYAAINMPIFNEIQSNFIADISIVSNGAIAAATNGVEAHHNMVGSWLIAAGFLGGAVRISNTGSIGAAGAPAGGIGVYAETFYINNGAGSGSIGIVNNGAIHAASSGVEAYARASGDVTVFNSQTIVGSAGVIAQSLRTWGGAGGNVTVVNSGSILAGAGDGVVAVASGIGSVVVNNTRSITATGGGVRASAQNGALAVANFGQIAAAGGAAIAIDHFPAGARQSQILNTGLAQGAGQSAASAVISIDPLGAGSAASANIVNSGVIRSNDVSPTAFAVAAGARGDGTISLANSGAIIGRMAMTDASDLFQNVAGGLWRTSGQSNFHGGADSIANAGQIIAVGDTLVDMGAGANAVTNSGAIHVINGAAIGRAAFSATGGSLIFDNSGLIDLQNDGAHSVANTATINGTFNAFAGSSLMVDAQLGPPGSVADRLIVNGPATGATTPVLVRDALGMGGALNRLGVTVVKITGADSSGGFVLNPASPGFTMVSGAPVIDTGLFYFVLDKGPGVGCDGAASCYSLYSGASTKARILPIATTTMQALWQETALMWEDRQTELRDSHFRATPRPVEELPSRKAPPSAPAAMTGRLISAWVKPLGAWTTRSNVVVTAIGPRLFSFDLSYRQNSFGLLGGGDYALALWGGEANVGVLGGFVESDVNFHAGHFFRARGGAVGATATFMKNGFFLDGLFKADLLSLQLGVPLGRFDSLWTTANTLGGVWNVGYRYDWDRVFLEPIATLTYSATRMGDLRELAAMGAQARFGAGEDFRGGFGGRVGATLPLTGQLLEASVTGRLWDQFASNRGRAVELMGGSLRDDALARVYGEVKGNLAMLAVGQGLGAYMSGGAKFNDQFRTWIARGGVAYRW